MKRLAIIPARGGSKRLPGKNLMELGGMPLIAHTIGAAAKTPLFDKVIVTTDSQEIYDYALNFLRLEGVQVALRPAELATDTSKVIDTVCYYFDKPENKDFDQIWLLLPTCPLRTSEDIRNAQALLSPNIDGVISITDYEFPPTLALNYNDDGTIEDAHPEKPWVNGNSRSQDHPDAYRPNGAIYGMWSEDFATARNFYRGNIKGYYMPRERSVDIDNLHDYHVAESIILNQ